jgi:hypothetical protein
LYSGEVKGPSSAGGGNEEKTAEAATAETQNAPNQDAGKSNSSSAVSYSGAAPLNASAARGSAAPHGEGSAASSGAAAMRFSTRAIRDKDYKRFFAIGLITALVSTLVVGVVIAAVLGATFTTGNYFKVISTKQRLCYLILLFKFKRWSDL